MFAGRYLIDGVVYEDVAGTKPVASTDQFYYNAAEDEARQRAEQLARANDDLLRRQQANADAWARQEPLPFPEAGFPAGYINPYGGYVPGTQPLVPPPTGDKIPDPRDALNTITAGLSSTWMIAGGLVLLALLLKNRR
jgi:hypothetical protein